MLTSMYGIIIVGSSLLIISALTSVIAFRIGAPLLLVFLTVGLLAGEDGPGGIQFDDAESVYFFGSIALAVILYDSGFNTKLQSLRMAAGLVLGWYGRGVADAEAELLEAWRAFAHGAPFWHG